MQLLLTPNDPLRGDFDPVEEARKMPPSYVVKGMFFTQLGRLLGDDFRGVQETLSRPPRLGRYVPFSDYPQGDYTLLAVAVARRHFAHLPLQEAIRRISRDDFSVFSDSTLGRVVLAAVRDPRAALLHVPKVYSTVAAGDWVITADEIGASTVRVQFNPHPSVWAYQLGQLEGILAAFGQPGRIRFEDRGNGHIVFDVELL